MWRPSPSSPVPRSCSAAGPGARAHPDGPPVDHRGAAAEPVALGPAEADLAEPRGAFRHGDPAGRHAPGRRRQPRAPGAGGEYLGENYRYVTGLCQEKGQWDGKPVRPQLSGARDSSRQRVLAAGQDAVHVVQQVTGYGSARSAGELIAHERAGFEHCAVLDHRETHVEFEIIATGFAGDEALLVRMSPRTLLVLVRVGAVYTELSHVPGHARCGGRRARPGPRGQGGGTYLRGHHGLLKSGRANNDRE
ncbi:hypothetical protein ACFQZ4_24910 [Catellatospora coxensis]